MKNICNEEKNLKRYLKNYISLNVETIVKFLITGMIGFSLTACGGGGGGSSSDSKPPVVGPEDPKPEPPVTPPVAEEVEVNKNNETHEVKNSSSVITGTISGTKNNFTALKAVNSTVENKAIISVTGDSAVGIHGTTDTALFSTRANHVVTNSGVISMSGHEAIGMLVENGVTGINKGDINLDSLESEEYITTEEIDDEIYVIKHTRKKMNFLIGMAAQNQGTILNEKNIKLTGTGIGMLALDKSKAINNGTISLESKEQICDVIESSLESNFTDNWQEIHFTEVVGIAGTKKSEITNGKSGVISLNGEGVGMVVIENSLANNEGQILGVSKLETILEEGEEIPDLESSEIIGMAALEKSTAINNGVISLEGASAYGMIGEDGSTIINNGTIDIKLINGVAGKYEVYDIEPEGMALENSSGENNGLITINGVQSSSTYAHSKGVTVSGGSFVNGKSGKIEIDVKGKSHITGIYADGEEFPNIDVTNNGSIKVAGANNGEYSIYLTGIDIREGNSVINNNEITVIKDETGFENENEITGIYAQGKRKDYVYYDKVMVENNGLINVMGSDSDMTFGIEAVGAEIKNNKNGLISVTANSGADGISAGDSNITNDGTIIVISENARGISAHQNNWENNLDGKIINNGKIEIEGNNSIGMTTYSTAINNGTINIVGENSKGINGTATNNGIINIDGKGSYGMYTGNNLTITNSATGIINVGISSVGGMYVGENSTGINDGTLNINQHDIDGDNTIFSNNGAINGMATNGGKITNQKNIIGKSLVTKNYGYLDWSFVNGMYGKNYGKVNNDGKIYLIGEGAGINVIESTMATNNGRIYIETLSEPHSENSFDKSYGIRGEMNSTLINEKSGEIYIADSGWGMYNEEGVVTENKGLISLERTKEYADKLLGGFLVGIEGYNSEIINSGRVEISGDKFVISNAENGAKSSGQIIGISGSNIINNGDIIINSNIINNSQIPDQNGAIGINSYKGSVENNDLVEVTGNLAIGIKSDNGKATNLGIINIDGEGSYGMYAENGAIIINGVELEDKEAQKNTGVINVGAFAASGMYAGYNSKAINYGTINIESGNSNAGSPVTDNLGNSISSAAMNTNGGTIENHGTINTDTNLTINSINGGAYVIGTSEDGSYGKISAKNVSIDGDVVVSAGITKNGFKNEYTMQNIVDAEDIKLGDNFNFTSNSLLYDAEAVTDRWGNLDATLSRNDKTLSDFTKGYITSTANIFGKYQNEEAIKTLSADAKEVIKAIDTTSVESIDETLNGLTPTIYANLGRQILETSETFKEQDMVAINSLGENSYNFTFIGEYQDVDSRDNIEGYKSKMTGFVGAMNFGDGTFGTIGYGYNDVDYKDNGKGHIQTIHLGLNRFGKYEGVDYNFGLGGEYNFHESKRDIDLLGRKAESDFDSYGVRASGEVSKVFGKEAYVKPYLGLDLAHMKYDSFTESKANTLNANIESENYTSVLPKVGLLVGDRFGGLNIFAGVEYSYELGNMDKEQNFSYEGFEGTAKLPKDDLECGTTGVKAGASYGVNNFTLGASIGKNFGRRHNSFGSVSLGYSF